VPRFVHCSSVHAFDLAAGAGRPVDETAPRAVRPQLPAYDRSKAAGEVEFRRLIGRGLDAVVVNPSGIIGPVDEAPSRIGAVLLGLWRRRLPALVPGGFEWVDVRDVVVALRAAATRARTGENYLVPGHRVSRVEMARLAAEISGPAVTRRMCPAGLARTVDPVAEPLVRWTGWPLLPTRESLHALENLPGHRRGQGRARAGQRAATLPPDVD
jgi:dihydroflavonol-4-reductase